MRFLSSQLPRHLRDARTGPSRYGNEATCSLQPVICDAGKLVGLIALVTAAMLSTGYAADNDIATQDAQRRHFETHIRPLLLDHCIDCHGPDSQDGGLRLDKKAGWQSGGDSGPAIVPSRPDESLLMRAVSYEDIALKMPPDTRLSADRVEKIRQWIEAGAFDPRGETTAQPSKLPDVDSEGTPVESLLESHWAYQKVIDPPPPQVDVRIEHGRPLDHFIVKGLASQGRSFSPTATGRTLVRRLFYDLTGLPPSPRDLERWSHVDHDAEARERLVDELLASRRFAEHFGRKWLDLARYAESVTLRGFTLPGAWRYRQYVIDAFDEDKPYADFVVQQIAGDLIETDDLDQRRQNASAAMLLLLGNTNFEQQDKKQLEMDIVDEQLTVVSRAFLAQTLECARCHDHKFDPISTKDYYALAGVFYNALPIKHGNISRFDAANFPLEANEAARFDKLRLQLDQAKKALSEARKALTTLESGPPVVAAESLSGIVVDDERATGRKQWETSQHSGRYVGSGYLHTQGIPADADDLTFVPDLPAEGEYEVRFAYSTGRNRSSKTQVRITHARGQTSRQIDQTNPPEIDGRFVSLGKFYFESGTQGWVTVARKSDAGVVVADAVQFLPLSSTQRRSGVDQNRASDESDDSDVTEEAKTASLKKRVERLENRVKRLQAKLDGRPKVLNPTERDDVIDLPVHVRGNPHRTGEMVQRRMPGFAGQCNVPIPGDTESGRRELAQWIASPENRLTWRVLANRIWLWTMGEGLVRTPDNFGTTGAPPTHPELLDYLASRLAEDQWSLKQLVRELVLSRTYRQSSASTESSSADPDNVWWGRAERKRLPAESIRDGMLAASDELTFQRVDPPAKRENDYNFRYQGTARSVFIPMYRNSIPEILLAFDFPSPSMSVGKRNASIVAPQGLFLMNSSFVMDRAEELADLAVRKTNHFADAFRLAMLRTIGRAPTAEELVFAESLIAEPSTAQATISESPKTPAATARDLTPLVHALLASPEFRYLD